MVDSFKIQQFGGMLPAWDARLLPEGQAAESTNAYLFGGALTGWRVPKLLRNLTNSSAKKAYRLPNLTQATASATVTFSTRPLEGDTITVGEETYTFVTAIQDGYFILIGVDVPTTIVNLYNALTGDNGLFTNQGVTYGDNIVPNPEIDQTTPITLNTYTTTTLTVLAPAFGAAYNDTDVDESTGGVRMSWSSPTLTGGLNQTFNPAITSSSSWLEFLDPDTDVMRSPVVDDQYNRYYFASPSLPPQYNTAARIQAGQSPWLLGVPAPGCAPVISVTGGNDNAQLGFPTSTSVNTGAPGANTIYLVPITPTGAMELLDVSIVPVATATAPRFCGVLYEDDNGNPGTLLNTGAIVTGCISGQTIVSAFVNPTGLLMNQQYWIGMMSDSAIPYQLADDTGASGVVSINTFSNGPPETITNLTVGYSDIQMWGDLQTSSVLEARSYVYTYVTAYDEESPPSPATLLTGWSNGTWTIGLFTPPPDQMGETRNITTTRIYRTISGTGGSTTYFHVADVPVNTASYTDIIDDSIVATNYQLPSALFFPPPENLQGIISMPNGMAVGFVGNEIWFCEPYFPHAWPPSYVVTTEFPIVGLGVSGNSLVAATSGTPYLLTGVTPSAMSEAKLPNPEPCISRGSVLGNADGVYYSSPNGLMFVSQAGSVSNITEMWVTREKWDQLTPQKNVRAIFLVSQYFAFGTTNGADTSVAQEGFSVELNSSDATSFTIWPQPGGHRLGFQQLTAPNGYNIDNIGIDPWSGVALLTQNGQVYYYDFTDPAPTIQPYTWRSRIYQQRSKSNFEVVRVFFDIPPGSPTQGVRNQAAFADSSWNTLGPNQYGILRVFADGNLVTAREIYTSEELLRIASGFKCSTWQFEVTARVYISNIKVGTSVKELAKV